MSHPLSSSSLPKVVLVEDEVLLLGLLSEFFVKSRRFEVIGTYVSGVEAVARICAQAPDLVVLDLQLPDMNGLAIVQQIRDKLANPPRMVVLSSGTNPLVVKQLFRLGVKGILQKGVTAAEVLAACERVVRGGVCLQLAEGDMANLAAAPIADSEPSLTARETEVLDMVARGRRSKEIAEVLGLSARTVDKHRENLMRKLGVNDVGGLVRYAANHGLLRGAAAGAAEIAGKGVRQGP